MQYVFAFLYVGIFALIQGVKSAVEYSTDYKVQSTKLDRISFTHHVFLISETQLIYFHARLSEVQRYIYYRAHCTCF